MPIETFESSMPATAQELFAWHLRPGAFERLCPPWQSIEIESPAPLEVGSRIRLRLHKGPLRLPWTAEHTEVTPGRGFVDVQRSGPFSRWVHRHEFEDAAAGARLRDRIDYRLPAGALGAWIAGRAVRRDLATTFAFRHEITRRDLARHRAFSDRPRLRVAISGSGGLVGSSLVPFLTTGGHEVVRLVRRAPRSREEAPWHADQGLVSPESIGPLDAIVHLAGESIASGRWTRDRKQRIQRSRVDGTRRLVHSLRQLPRPPRTLVCASAIGFYGDRGSDWVDEQSAPGNGFLADTGRAWEEAAGEAEALGIRVVQARFGIVLSPGGGALAKMLPVFRLGLGGPIGNGGQYMSWVSIDDAVGAIHHLLMRDDVAGPVNVVAPAAATNRDFTDDLARTLGRPAILPLPAPGARLLFGEMADEMLLASTRVRPGRLAETNFRFEDCDLPATLRRLLGRVEATGVVT